MVIENIEAAGVQSDRVTWAKKMERKIRRKNVEAAKLQQKGDIGCGGEGGEGDGEEGADRKPTFNADENVDDEQLYQISVRLQKARVCYEILRNIFDYNPEDFDWQELSEEDAKTVVIMSDLLVNIKMENEVNAEEKKGAGGAKQREQFTFER